MTIIECKSGFTFEARKWRLKDMEDLADRAEAAGAGDDLIVGTVGAQWVRTIDPGPYPFVTEGNFVVEWNRILKPDILWSLFRIRAASWPADPERGITPEHYHFDATCPHCKPTHVFPQMMRLDGLKFRALPEASRKIMQAGKSFEAVALDGKRIIYNLPCTQQDIDLNVYLNRFKRKGKAKHSDAHAAQTVSISGLKSNDLATKVRYFANLELAEFIHIRNQMTAAGCHIITKVDATCDLCKSKFETKLPLRGSFFMPEDPMDETPAEVLESGSEMAEEAESTTTASSSESSAPTETPKENASPG